MSGTSFIVFLSPFPTEIRYSLVYLNARHVADDSASLRSRISLYMRFVLRFGHFDAKKYMSVSDRFGECQLIDSNTAYT
jgi:hypothetical protein